MVNFGVLDKIKSRSFYLILSLWLITFIVTLVEYWRNFPLYWAADTYSYMAFIREMATGRLPPQEAWAPVITTTEWHYGPYIVLLGYIHQALAVDPKILLYSSGLLNTAFFIFSAYLFLRSYFDGRTVFFILFSFLFLWGYPLYYIAGMYGISDSYNLFFAPGIAYSLLFTSLFFLKRIKEDKKNVVFCVISGELLFLTHMNMGIFFFIITGLYILFEIDKTKESILRHGVIPPAIFFISLFWPYFSVLDRIMLLIPMGISPLQSFAVSVSNPETALNQSSPLSYFYKKLGDFLLIFGFGIIGVIGLHSLFKQKKIFFPAWFAFCLLWYVLDFPLSLRVILLAGIPLHVGAGILLNKLSQNRESVYLWIGALLFIYLLNLKIIIHLIRKYSQVDPSLTNTMFYRFSGASYVFSLDVGSQILFGAAIIGVLGLTISLKKLSRDDYTRILFVVLILLFTLPAAAKFYDLDTKASPPSLKFIEEYTPPGSVILTDPRTGKHIPGLTGRKVVRVVLPVFFGEETSYEERTDIIEKYNVTHVLINRQREDIRLKFLLIYENENFRLYKITDFF